MSVMLELPAAEGLPEDLRLAMGQVFATARKYSDSEVHALRAALSIALQYVSPPLPPEMVVQWADEPVEYLSTEWGFRDGVYGFFDVGLTVPEESFYLVCPHCWTPNNPSVATDGTEYMKAFTEGDELAWNEELGVLTFGGDDDQEFTGDVSYFLCGQCNQRSLVPPWMSAEW